MDKWNCSYLEDNSQEFSGNIPVHSDDPSANWNFFIFSYEVIDFAQIYERNCDFEIIGNGWIFGLENVLSQGQGEYDSWVFSGREN